MEIFRDTQKVINHQESLKDLSVLIVSEPRGEKTFKKIHIMRQKSVPSQRNSTVRLKERVLEPKASRWEPVPTATMEQSGRLPCRGPQMDWPLERATS